MTLGELIATLNGFDEGLEVELLGRPAGELSSYRGYYDQLALEPADRGDPPQTVGELKERCGLAVGATFEGYKGGDFTMDLGTAMWASEYGHNSGLAIVGAAHTGSKVQLLTADISAYG